jgi:hypothetical protein
MYYYYYYYCHYTYLLLYMYSISIIKVVFSTPPLSVGTRCAYTLPKKCHIFKNTREQVSWRGNFLVVLGNEASFPRITWEISPLGTSSPTLSEICLVFLDSFLADSGL